MEKIIHFTVPEELTPIQIKSIDLARALHPGWEIKVWQDPVSPSGYLLEKYWPKVNSGAQFADLLRLDLLYKWGGVYVDSDLLLLKPLDELAGAFDFFIASEDGKDLTNALFGAQKAHPAIRALIDELLLNEPDWSLQPDKTTGPIMLSKVLKWNRQITVLPRETFYAYDFTERHSRRIHRHSYGEHLWVYSWEATAGYKTVTPPRSAWLKSISKQVLATAAKRIVKPVVMAHFRIWNRLKSLDPSVPNKQKLLQESNFYPVSTELVVRTLHGFNLVVDGNDTSITPDLVFGGFYELPEEFFAKRILRGGDWAIDVGSNVGRFCMLAGQCVKAFGRVFAYEPNPRVSKLFAKSVVMNWMHDRIVLRPVVVGDATKEVRLAFNPQRLGDAQVEHENTNSIFNETTKYLEGEDLAIVNVPSVTLDEEFPVDLPIKLLKIDVEGYENSVLKGARRLLERRCIDFILIEVSREVAGSQWADFMSQLGWLTESNYVACTLTEDGSLVEHTKLATALEKLEGRNIVLKARDQFTATI